jgi:hypothetical protein
MDPKPAEPIEGDVVPEYPPTTTLPGLLFALPFEDIPSPLNPSGRRPFPFPLPAPSTMEFGLVAVGVPLGVGFGVVSVVLDLLEDDRGVMLLLIRAFTGVDKSSLVAPLLIVLGVLGRADFVVVGVVAPRY